MYKAYPIEILENGDDILIYPGKLKLPHIHTISFGSLSVRGKAGRSNSNQPIIKISRSLAEQLKIPEFPVKLHMFVKEGQLFLGPVVGIFTEGFTSFPDSPLGTRSYAFSRYFIHFTQAGILPVIFGVNHIHWDQGIITGYIFYENKWRQLEVPLPNVIYDRIPNRKVENLPLIQNVKKRLQEEYAIPWFNPGFFSKLEVYKLLNKNPETKIYLPETVPFTNRRQLETMLSKYNFLYIKPDSGSHGNGIFRIRTTGGKIYISERENHLIRFASVSRAFSFLEKHTNITPYLIQQGIPLITREHRTVDFRLHTNRNAEGKWQVTAMAGKVAARNGITTHILSGGEVITLEQLFPEPEQNKKIRKKLADASLTISEHLETSADGILGEIGFDFGIDKKEKVWLLEANAKPGRLIFKHPEIKKYERYINRTLFHFTIYLTERVVKQPEQLFKNLILQ